MTTSSLKRLLRLIESLWLFYCVIGVYAASQWNVDNIGNCSSIFRRSRREVARRGQKDPLLLWIGNPAVALHVKGKHGPVPLPTIWHRFINVIYITNCGPESNRSTNISVVLVDFLELWLHGHVEFHERPIFFTGNLAESKMGENVLAIAVEAVGRNFPVAGVLTANLDYTPAAQFFGNRPLFSGNGMNEWTINRMHQSVLCNGYFTAIEFQMNDAKLRYAPIISRKYVGDTDGTPERASLEEKNTIEYTLVSVSTFDTCYSNYAYNSNQTAISPNSTSFKSCTASHRSLKDFEIEWSNKPAEQNKHEICPLLPRYSDDHFTHSTSECVVLPFPPCPPLEDMRVQPFVSLDDAKSISSCNSSECYVDFLLTAGVTVVAYATLYGSSSAICSFYIGMYESDGNKFDMSSDVPKDDSYFDQSINRYKSSETVSKVYRRFNQVALEPFEAAWSETKDSSVRRIGLVQDGSSAINDHEINDLSAHTQPSTSRGNLIWIQFDDSVNKNIVRSSSSHKAANQRSHNTGNLDVQLNMMTAVDMLSRLVGHFSEIEYMEVMFN